MAGTLNALFELLLRYPPVAYRRGEVVLASSWSPVLLMGGLAAIVGVVAWSYLRSRETRSAGSTWLLAGIRAAGIGLLVLCLLRPTLVLSTAVPRENVVAIVMDDSRSMGIADVDGRTRGEAIREVFASEGSPLLRELEERFLVRPFRFSARSERLDRPEALTFQGHRTRLGSALVHVRRELASVPLAGVVLVTDGGDQDSDALEDALLAYRAEGIPIHVVGAGSERLEPDVEVERVELPASVLRGSTVLAEVVVSHRGLDGARVPVQVEEDGRLLASEEVELLRGGGSVTVQLPFTAESSGVRRLRVRVPAQSEEIVTENNVRDVALRVRGEPERILYFEGEPRFEVGFLRRALRDDRSLRVTVLQRTGEDRYLRLDLEDPDELTSGFPRSREELFRYRAVVLGSVEASYFSPDQLRMLAEFVDRRGGGLLFLGGRRALGEGGFAGTPLAPLLPVEPAGSGEVRTAARPGASGNDGGFVAELRVRPTPRGAAHPALRLVSEGGTDGVGGDEAEGAWAGLGWEGLPVLTTVNRLGIPRAGATVLLQGEAEALPGGGQPVLAFQRYGAGLAALLAVQDTWLWQMHGDIPLEDDTHGIFWRQLLRWLVQDVSDPLAVRVARERVAPDEAVEVVARVKDGTYLPLNNARVVARIVDPLGGERELPLTWSLERDGEYRGSFLPEEDGPHEIRVEAVRGAGEEGEDRLVSEPLHVEAGVLDEELRSGAMRGELLRRIARETGGDFYTLDGIASLPEALRYTERGTVVQEERELWDVPLVFLLLLGLLSAEWLLRRRTGRA